MAEKRSIILETKNAHTKRIKKIFETHRSYDALQYPLLLPWGDDGFHLAIVARVAAMYLSKAKCDSRFMSPLAEAFAERGLGEPDFALFWDFPWCVRVGLDQDQVLSSWRKVAGLYESHPLH